MQQLIHGNLIHAPALGRLEILEHGWMPSRTARSAACGGKSPRSMPPSP